MVAVLREVRLLPELQLPFDGPAEPEKYFVFKPRWTDSARTRAKTFALELPTFIATGQGTEVAKRFQPYDVFVSTEKRWWGREVVGSDLRRRPAQA